MFIFKVVGYMFILRVEIFFLNEIIYKILIYKIVKKKRVVLVVVKMWKIKFCFFVILGSLD